MVGFNVETVGARGGNGKGQYLFSGELLLVIVVSLVATFVNLVGPNTNAPDLPDDPAYSNTPKGMHFWCAEAKKEVVLDPSKFKPDELMGDPVHGMRVVNPETGKRTLIPMMSCPKCKKWFVPESWKDPKCMMMPNQRLLCTHCKTDVIDYQRNNRRKKRCSSSPSGPGATSPAASSAPKGIHYWCTDTKKEIVLDPRKFTPEQLMVDPVNDARLVNPETGKRTLIPMMACPKCHKYFVPESWKEPDGMMKPNQRLACTHCKTDVLEYYREMRKKKKRK